jgi:HlyD family secretion protein
MNQPSDDMTKTLGLDGRSKITARLRPYLLWGGIALAVMLAVSLWFGLRSSGQAQYQTQQVKRGSLTVTVSATGTLQPTNKVEVGSEISGTIKSVRVDYNDKVKRGQALAEIDTTKLQAQARQSAASLDAAGAKVLQAEATVAETKAKLTRLEEVQQASGGKVPSKAELDTARANLARALADEANARATVAQAEATLEAQRTDIAKAVIRSPINGVVLSRAAEPGQTVAASYQTPVLFTLAEDLTQMELLVDVDEADVGKVRQGLEATFTVDAYSDRRFPAKVSEVRYGSKTVSGVVTYTTVLKVNNTDMLLRPGMTGTANIVVQKADDVLLVPNTALRFEPPQTESKPAGNGGLVGSLLPRPPGSATRPSDNGTGKQPQVWVLREDQPEKVLVKTGLTDGVLTEVTEGKLDPGMAVVVDVIEAKK